MEPNSDKFMSDEEGMAELVSLMPEADREVYAKFGHNRLEAAFLDRAFIVYRCEGRNSKDIQRPPKVISTIRVIGFHADASQGCTIKLLDEETETTLEVGHVPVRLFDYPVFVSAPQRMSLKWDAHRWAGKVVRNLTFVLFVKTANKAEFFSKGNIYMETPNKLRELYPHLTLDLTL